MKLTIPFNGQPDLLGRVNKEKVVEVYGKLTSDPVGGGRPSSASPFVSKGRLVAAIRETHGYGLKFNYLFNGGCLGNMEYTRWGQRKIRAFLDWLTKIGVDNITVSIPYLLEVIKKCYPHFEVTVSNIAEVNSIRRAKQWEELGADAIVLFDVDMNRSFSLIRKIRKDVRCKLKLIANDDTVNSCALYAYHALIDTHASQNHSSSFLIDSCKITCRLRRLNNPILFIRGGWIRPEDAHYYEEAGIDMLKLVDRTMITEAIVRIVDAYTKGRHEGNLLDLMAHPSVNLLAGRPNILKKIKYYFRPFTTNIFKLYKAKEVVNDFEAYIDNRSLDGFIEFFLKNNCDLMSCEECGYCDDVAKRVVKINPEYREKSCRLHRNLLDQVVSGDIFRY